MRFPIVWITLALCVVLCAFEVQCGPVDHQNQDLRLISKEFVRSGRQEPYNDDSGQEGGDENAGGSDEESDGDDEAEDDNSGGDDGDDEEERSFKRHVREVSQKPLLTVEQPDEDSVIPSTDLPITDNPTKKPSVLLLLTSALDKAIAATTKLPTQQMASDAASVFLYLGQVFSEALDNVIGEDGPEEVAAETEATATEAPVEEQTQQLPFFDQAVKVEKQPQIMSSQNVVRFGSS